MFAFLLRKMINNKWMIISLLVGNILLIATVSSVPLYRNATLQRMLLKEMQDFQIQRNMYPGMVDLRNTFSNQNAYELELFRYYREITNAEIERLFGIPKLDVGFVESLTLYNAIFYPESPREETPRGRACTMSGFMGIEGHIRIVQGRMYTPGVDEDGYVEAICAARTLEQQDILLGETLIDERRLLNGEPLRIKIVGIFENLADQDPYWVTSPNYFNDRFIIDHGFIEWMLYNSPDTQYRAEATWMHLFDYNQMEVRKVNQYTRANDQFKELFEKNRYATRYRNNFEAIISTYQAKADSLSVTLWVLQVPVFILLAFFIYMVSRQILIIEQNEISVVKSRGANRRQIIALYFWQGIIICAISAPVATVPLATFICKILGSSNGFLDFVQRSALQVIVIPEAFIYSAVAVVFSMLTMTLPVVRYSRVTIVDHKRAQSARRKKPVWQTFYLDVLAFGVSVYGLYSFNRYTEIYSAAVTDLQSIDPLMFLCSSLFILGLGLLLLRLYPLIIKFIYTLFKNVWTPAFYASFIRLVRSAGDEQFIMIFLIFTLAVGVFNAKAARTINLNAEDKIHYSIGADLTFREIWSNNLGGGEDAERPQTVVYQEPDFEKYKLFDEVYSLAKVYTDAVTVSLSGGNLSRVQMMAVNTKEFGETAWYRDDLFQAHFYEYLNALAVEPAAVLLSVNFKETYDFKVNDTITIRDSQNNFMPLVIHGFVEFWPGYARIDRARASDGRITERENWLIVSNLHFVQSQTGMLPYSVWMKTGENSHRFIYDYAERSGIKFTSFKDGKDLIIRGRNDPLLQGTNGVLTVGFVIIILICAAGFLIYWILAIKSRVLQFGIFRALGMGFKSILAMMAIEQVIITGAAIALGVAAGEVSSRLFVPIIQLAYTAAEKIIPFMVITETDDYMRLLAITGVMIVACMGVLGVIISRIKITQALKLGED